jgi:hypothetical protein
VDAQAELVQTCWGPHAFPQDPQFRLSLARLVQRGPASLGHSDVDPTQVGVHAPAEQICPAGHAAPQAPQFALSLCVSAQYGGLPAAQ